MLSDLDKQFFMERVSKQDDGCWVWTGGMAGGRTSYPATHIHDEDGGFMRTSARRVSWLLFKNPNECGGIIKCKANHLCVNPDHLKVNHSNISDISEQRIEELRRGVHAYLSAGRRRKVSMY